MKIPAFPNPQFDNRRSVRVIAAQKSTSIAFFDFHRHRTCNRMDKNSSAKFLLTNGRMSPRYRRKNLFKKATQRFLDISMYQPRNTEGKKKTEYEA